MFVIETTKWMMDKSYIRYHIAATSVRSIHVLGYFGSEKHMYDILKIEINDSLPIKKIVYFPKYISKIRVVYKDGLACWSGSIETGTDAHKNQLTVSIDNNNFFDLKVQSVCIKNVETIPSKLVILNETKLPLIGFFDNSYIIYHYKEDKGYEILGKFGEEMFISFDEKKPKFGHAAIEVMKCKPGFVVFDLLNIIKMDPENITSASHWGFKLTKDAQNPILIQFKNFCGGIRAATPAFLLALILRQQLKAIENQTGEKPTKIAVCVMEDEDEMAEGGEAETNNEEAEDGAEQSSTELNAEMKRLKDGIKKACELLKVECIFVNEHVSFKYYNN